MVWRKNPEFVVELITKVKMKKFKRKRKESEEPRIGQALSNGLIAYRFRLDPSKPPFPRCFSSVPNEL